jgi:ribosomal protein S18 acetylase RimI-like enzyme
VLDEKKRDDSIIIENALAGDDDTAALLTLMAYKDFSYDMFGVSDDEKILEYYRKLWKFDNNRFSYRYSHVAKKGSKPIGLMTCYPAELTKKLVCPTVARLVKIGGMRFVRHVLTHMGYFYQFAKTVEARPDEFYIGTLAVLPEFRGNNIGVMLLERMRILAESQGFRKCALLVEAVNEDAVRFYERNGFVKVLYSERPRAYFRVVKSFEK